MRLSMLVLALTFNAVSAMAAPRVGEPAPNLSLKDDAGLEHTLAGYKGRYVVLEWTSTKCPYVVSHYERGTMKKTAERFAAKNVVWLGIDSSHYANSEASRDFKKKYGITWPVLQDVEGKVGKLYDAKTTPHMFVIDPEGVLRYDGAIDDDKTDIKGINAINFVAQSLDALIAKRPVSPAKTEPYGCSVKYK